MQNSDRGVARLAGVTLTVASAIGVLFSLVASAESPARTVSTYADYIHYYSFPPAINGHVAPSGEPWFSTPYCLLHFFGGIPCVEPADYNGDGFVDSQDLAFILGAWTTPSHPFNPMNESLYDLNHDGRIGSGDIALLLGQWGFTVCAQKNVEIRRQLPQDPLPDIQTVASTGIPKFDVALESTLSVSVHMGNVSIGTYIEAAPHSRLEDQDVTRIMAGGYHFAPSPLAPFVNSSHLLDRYVIMGSGPNGEATLFVTQKPVVAGTYTFTQPLFVLELTTTGMRVLIRDSQTIQMFGFSAPPVEIFPAGPFGAAVDQNGIVAPSPNALPGATSVDQLQFRTGEDPPPGVVRDYQLGIVYFGAFTVQGVLAP